MTMMAGALMPPLMISKDKYMTVYTIIFIEFCLLEFFVECNVERT